MQMKFNIVIAPWPEVAAQSHTVRNDVFVTEQNIPLELEWDSIDPVCIHALAIDNGGNAIGTARLLSDGYIGRVAVLAAWRSRGVGRAILEALIQEARRRGYAKAMLNAQSYAIGFYAKSGFEVAGDEYCEAGIPHVPMVRTLR
jgi:predicted GNAT family N-acyltransferase